MPEVPQDDIPSGAVEVIAKIGRKNNPTEPVADDFTVEGGPQRVATLADAYQYQGGPYWKEGVQFYVLSDQIADDGFPERGSWRVYYDTLTRETMGYPAMPGGGDGAIQYNQGGQFAGDESKFAFRYPGFLGTGKALPDNSRYYDEYRSGLFIPGAVNDNKRAWGIFGPNGYPLQSFEYREVLGQYGPWNINHTTQSLNVNGGVIPETRNVYGSYLLLDADNDYEIWRGPAVRLGAGVGHVEIRVFCCWRYNGQIVGGTVKLLRFGVVMDESGNWYLGTQTGDSTDRAISEQNVVVQYRLEESTDTSGSQYVRLVISWTGEVDDVKVGLNVNAQYFSSNLFFNNPALNICPEFLPQDIG